ncbi:N-acetylglucosamine kinase [Microbacterium sp. OVT16B]|uniref:N-acetylglucosamine kinase n=1 Tax=Microbacterium sp. OVT16B TaxID=2862682 RepID=UPI001CC09167|nr:BadF/BadG/BcrA/BcrD ATPase family protein [Microbacterium sp. OVT16B]
MTSPAPAFAVDLGKTRCRVVRVVDRERVRHDGVGAPGLAAPHGADAAFDAIVSLLARFEGPIGPLGVGAAGAWAAPQAASALARRLARQTGAPVVVASDVVTAHAGALDGAEGTLLIAGTGAAALGADADGVRLVDGWGPELGDFGSGSWLGREALRAVVRASSGLGPATVLTAAVEAVVGPASAIPSWIGRDEPLARRLAQLAPLVLDSAERGDDVARAIADEAVRLLTATTVAASRTANVALHGGLTDHGWFRARLTSSLDSADRTVVASAGDAIDGALMLALRTDLPHERFAHRAE